MFLDLRDLSRKQVTGVFFTLQIIIKVLGSWAALMLEIFDKYGEGDFDFSKG
jgi:hypothetical protein